MTSLATLLTFAGGECFLVPHPDEAAAGEAFRNPMPG
jgi:hypothetical protein